MIPIIFINCSRFPFIRKIMRFLKLYETRTRNMLGSFLGQRVLLAETGHGRPLVKCSAVISEVIAIRSREEWNKYRKACAIPARSQYDWKPWTKVKWLYRLTDVQPVDPFVPPEDVRHGRTWMECHLEKFLLCRY